MSKADEFGVRDIIFKEWDIVENAIRNYEPIFLRCRTWALTLFFAFVAASFQYNSVVLPLIAIPVLLGLMYFELVYMTRQHIMIGRSIQIQELLNKNNYEGYSVEFSEMLRRNKRQEMKEKFERTNIKAWILSPEYWIYWIMTMILIFLAVSGPYNVAGSLPDSAV